jgi:tetratricopeptide (TPR) repeat protein
MDHFDRARELYESGNIEGAAHIYEQVIARQPSNWFAMYALGSIYSQAGRNGIAIPLLQRSLEENPKQPEALNNLAVSFRVEGHEEIADSIYEMALKQSPDNYETWCNRAGAHINNGDPEKCLEYSNKALEIKPDYAQALYHKGMALLEMGKYEEGFDLYRYRTKIKEYTPRKYIFPRWDGAPVKRLLIHGEQGIGDEILFLGFFNRIQADEIVIECTKKAKALFERSFNCVCVTTEEEAMALGEFDAVVAMGDLPRLLGILPDGEKYLVPDPQKVAYYRAKAGDRPLIGLSWYGGLKKTHTHLRNVHPDMWKRFTQYNCTSLQYGDTRVGAEMIGIPDWQPEEDDIDDRAALIAACDLVISVCNTTIHMAGALGVPCWVLVPDRPAWRYGLSGDSMPWYKSVKLYRKKEEWESVFNQVEKDLADFAGVSGTEQKAA